MSAEGDDVRLARLIETLTDDLRRGRSPDLERATRENPDLAPELRELWEAVVLAEEVARWASTEVERDDSAETTAHWVPGDAAFDSWSRIPGPQWCASDDEKNTCELIREIGRGGMGVVYLARHAGTGRLVAVKRMLGGERARSEDLARFRQESLALTRLQHPNVLGLFHSGTHQGELYHVLPYVDGTTLARRLAQGPLRDVEAARLIQDVARAVHHAHRCDVLHRDLKPSNILIDREGRPFVSDFGLAKVSRTGHGPDLTPSGAALGTPGYMAPEQARGTVGPAADVYGLGAILYHALTGRPPFQASTPLDTLLLVLEQEPVPPRVLNPTVSPDLEMVALKCLQKDPSQRYDSAEALADDLRAFLDGEVISARSTSIRALAGRMLGETHLAPV
ncbi:MAG: serine/threonine-protein kinase, partial [Isosphaeraceae bacterium]